jgi:uncharacterized protein (DUF927 family)
MSCWGNPQVLIKNFNSTTVGLERLLEFNSDLPVALDEKMIADNQKSIEKMVFLVGNGEGRIRGNKTGGLTKNVSFCNIVLSTGEEPLAQENSTTGISSRCLEIEGAPFSSENEAKSIYKIIPNCYGHAGKIFISNLIQQYSNTEYMELQEKFKKIEEKIDKLSNSNVSSYISSVAVVVLADILVSKWIFNENNEESSIDMGIKILNDLQLAEEIDIVEKAYQNIKSYILANHVFFGTYTSFVSEYKLAEDVAGVGCNLGIRENNVYYVFAHKLRQIMMQNGYNPNQFLREFARRRIYSGYI